MSAPKYIQFVDSLVKLSVAELEQKQAAGPLPKELDEWDLVVDEWQLAVQEALREVRDRG